MKDLKDLQVPCIVCGSYITWDDSALPAACSTHTYQEVFEAFDAAEQSLHQTGLTPRQKETIRQMIQSALDTGSA